MLSNYRNVSIYPIVFKGLSESRAIINIAIIVIQTILEIRVMYKSVISSILSACLASAAPVSLGTIQSTGEFRVDGSTISGNATAFDGNLIETISARAVVQLGREQITLSPNSIVKLYHGRSVLEKGTSLVRDANHVIEAATLQISSTSKNSLLQVEMPGPNHISVAAHAGSIEVHNGAGLLIARLNAGMAVDFEPKSGIMTSTNMTGVLEVRDGRFYLTDKTAHVTAELRGADLAKYSGKTVEVGGDIIPGTTPAGGASLVVQVTATKLALAALAAATPGAVVATAGVSSSAIAGVSMTTAIAIGGGVAAAGSVIGLARAGTFSSAPAASRP